MGKILQLHEGEQLPDLGPDRRLGRALPPRLGTQPEGDVLEHAHVLEQRIMLEDETDVALAKRSRRNIDIVEQNLAARIGRFDAGDDAQQSGLA